jgi:hypothetical protein
LIRVAYVRREGTIAELAARFEVPAWQVARWSAAESWGALRLAERRRQAAAARAAAERAIVDVQEQLRVPRRAAIRELAAWLALAELKEAGWGART